MYFPFYDVKKIIDIVKKICIVIVVYVVIISLFFHFTSGGKKNDPIENSIAKEREIFYKTFSDQNLQSSISGNIMRGSVCFLIGELCTDNPADGEENFKHSVFGFMTNLITLPFANPPASGVYWASSSLENAGLIPKSYAAQGLGLAGLIPIKDIWLVFRNFVFMIMVIIIVAIGFMIMFRTKINQQTVISIENSLPRIVIALLLITFSYPIAGFMIDLMYITIGFIAILFGNLPSLNTTPTKLFNEYFLRRPTIFSTLDPVQYNVAWNVSEAFIKIIPVWVRAMLNGAFFFLFERFLLNLSTLGMFGGKTGTIVKTAISSSTQKILGGLTGFFSKLAPKIPYIGFLVEVGISTIAGIALQGILLTSLLFVVLGITILMMYFRIFFMLLSAYINILLLIIFSPLILAAEAIPGKSSFGTWVKNLTLALATFPLLILFVLIALTILRLPENSFGSLWKPPYLFSFDSSALQAIVGGALIFMAPDFIKMIKQMTGIKPLPFDISLGGFFAGGALVGGGAMGLFSQVGSIGLSVTGIKSLQEALGKSKLGAILKGVQSATKPTDVSGTAS